MARLKVLICGGGIAGNALACWLGKMCHDVTIIERFSNLRSTGLQLDLRGHGVEVLRRMDLEQAFRAKSVPEQGLELVDSSGKRRAYFPANRSGKGVQSFTTDFEIMRGDLVKLLHDDAIMNSVNYVFGTTIESFEECDGAVNVVFSDGKRDRFDLLVGADGQGSRTRRMMLGPSTPDQIQYLDGWTAYFTIPWSAQGDQVYRTTTYMATGFRFVLLRRSNPHQVQVYLTCRSNASPLQTVQKGDVRAEKKAFAEIFRDAGWRCDNIVEAMQRAEDFYCERPGVVRLDAWSSGRVALVGDAAYCPTANTGMGTSSSMIGAYILAGEISKHSGARKNTQSLTEALQSYERKFRPFMDQVQHGIGDNSRIDKMLPSGRFGIALMNSLMGLAAFCRLDVLGRFVLREKVTDWTLPIYEEMVGQKRGTDGMYGD